MQKNRLSWMIGGPQGSGINASAEVFAKACSRAGLRVFANIEYHSNIMGKHSFYRVRVDEDPIHSYRDKADILVALDHETLAGDGGHRRWPTHYGHLTELRSRSLDRHTCRVMTPDEHALMGALAAARNEDRSTDSS